MSVYPSFELDVYLNSAWVSLLAEQIGEISGRDGIGRTGYTDRVASQGSLRTELNNLDGKFIPGGSNALAGWRGSVPMRLNFVYDNETVNAFTGRLDTNTANAILPAWLNITAFDWMHAASTSVIKDQEMLTNRTADDAIRVLLAAMPWRPTFTRFSQGTNVFPTLFDDMGRRASPASEIAKLILSELGFLYMRRDDTLVLEAMGERARLLPVQTSPEFALADEFSESLMFEDGEDAIFEDGEGILFNDTQAAVFENSADYIPVVTELAELMLFEDGEEALFEDGVPIAFNDVEEAVFGSDEFIDLDVEYGPNYFNFSALTAYPRNVDEDAVQLYNLGEPLALPAGVPVPLKGNWTNPTSGQIIGGVEVDTPAGTANYLANTKSEGAGSDLTPQLVVQSWETSANGFDALLMSPAGGWLRKWTINGKGVYSDDHAYVELANEDVIARDGELSLPVDQRYLDGFNFSKAAVEAELLFQRERRLEGTRIHLLANKSPKQMMAFLYLQTGQVIRVASERHEIDHFYTIYDRQYSVQPGNVIPYSFGIRRTRSQADVTEVEMQFAISSSTTQEAVAIGVLPNWASHRITFFCEVFVSGVSGVATLMSLPFLSGGENTFLRLQVNSAGVLLARTSQFATAGTWTSDGDSVGSGAWVPVAVTYDSESLSNVPKFYINGVLQSVAGGATQPTGSRVTDEPLTFLEVGGHFKEQSSTTYNMRVRRHRWFNDVLTAGEILELTRTPADMGLYKDRLLLGGFAIPNEYAADWIDGDVSETMKVIDLVAAAVSTEVSGTPTIRAIT